MSNHQKVLYCFFKKKKGEEVEQEEEEEEEGGGGGGISGIVNIYTSLPSPPLRSLEDCT